MKRILSIVTVIALAGCASAEQQQAQVQHERALAVRQQIVNEYRACRQDSFVAETACDETVEKHDPFMANNSERTTIMLNKSLLAEKVKAGKMTNKEAKLANDEFILARQDKDREQLIAAIAAVGGSGRGPIHCQHLGTNVVCNRD